MSTSPHSTFSRNSRCPCEVSFGDFAESQPKDFTDLIDEEESTGDYGDFSDGDLEDDEDEVSLNTARNLQGISPAIPGGSILLARFERSTEKGGRL